jgi:hypothetical protein
MAGLLDLLNSDLGKNLVTSTSKQLGQDTNKTSSALTTALPLLLGAMKKNTTTTNGAEGLLNALSSKHDGSILNNLEDALSNQNVLQDGEGILKHIFSGKEQNIAKAVSSKSGIDAGSAMNLLKMAAPVIMGYLGKQAKEKQVNDSNGLGNLLGDLLGNSDSNSQNLVSQLLDADGDGSVIDDIIGMASDGEKSGFASLLGGLFGKK